MVCHTYSLNKNYFHVSKSLQLTFIWSQISQRNNSELFIWETFVDHGRSIIQIIDFSHLFYYVCMLAKIFIQYFKTVFEDPLVCE